MSYSDQNVHHQYCYHDIPRIDLISPCPVCIMMRTNKNHFRTHQLKASGIFPQWLSTFSVQMLWINTWQKVTEHQSVNMLLSSTTYSTSTTNVTVNLSEHQDIKMPTDIISQLTLYINHGPNKYYVKQPPIYRPISFTNQQQVVFEAIVIIIIIWDLRANVKPRFESEARWSLGERKGESY